MEQNDIRWPDHGAKPMRKTVAALDGHSGELLDQKDKWTIIRCDLCEFIHTIPIPHDFELAEFYRSAFYEREQPAYIRRYENDRAWWELTHLHNANAAGAVMANRNGICPKVLDVGTGPGIFLDVASMLSWETHAIEPSKRCTKRLQRRGHVVYQGMLEDYVEDVGEPMFDFVHAYEVLEHAAHPIRFIQDCRSLLVPHGLLGIVVPNDYNTLQLKAQEEFGIKDRWWVAPPQHLNYFTPNSLCRLFDIAGFDLLELRGTWPMEMYLFAGHNYIGNDKIGRQCHKNRMAQEKAIEKSGMWNMQRKQLQLNIASAVGREMFVLGRMRV